MNGFFLKTRASAVKLLFDYSAFVNFVVSPLF
jgi:hypothetical protein